MELMLKEFRKLMHLTQSQAAETLGIDQRQWSRYENGKNEMPARYIRALCMHYQVSADIILGIPNWKEGT